MGVGLDPRGDAQDDPGRRADTGGGEHVEPIEFVEGVDDDVPHLGLDGLAEFVARLVVAVHGAGARRDAGGQRHVEFPARGDVEQQALVVRELCHRPAQERLGRIDDPLVSERGDGFTTPRSQMGLVVDEQRRAELLGEFLHRASADREHPVVPDGRRVRQQPTTVRPPSHLLRGVDAEQAEGVLQGAGREVGEGEAAGPHGLVGLQHGQCS